MVPMTLYLLGPPRLERARPDGDAAEEVRISRTKVTALLAYLATEADRPHRRDALATLLWPNSRHRAARANLRRDLSNLRRLIGDPDAQPPFLTITRDTIQFNAASDSWVDVAAFKTLMEANQPDDLAAEQLQEAVALYQGPFLEGFEDKEGINPARTGDADNAQIW